ncbi:transcriptional regulator [Nocardia sp. NPDC006044]|uniref:transcriptional regulator n=1 Tax=Nocardia sp. NPDC006044 TaxID=3364306 RepID=UPI0036AEA5EE
MSVLEDGSDVDGQSVVAAGVGGSPGSAEKHSGVGEHFAPRLNTLYAEWSRRHRRRLTNQMVVDALTRYGIPVSLPYLSQLRRGRRTQPSATLVAGLAQFFEVDPEYLYSGHTAYTAADTTLVTQLDDPVLRRLTNVVTGLSVESIDYLVRVAEKFRQAEMLPIDDNVATL